MTRNLPPSITDRHASVPFVVFGLDPGTLVTGYGIVARTAGRATLVDCGTIVNAPGLPMSERLQTIYDGLAVLIARHHPDAFAIESAFYGKNAQSALKLGHARGVSLLAAVKQGLPSAEYSPREIKKAVTGNGSASKEQVRYMVKTLLGIAGTRMKLDASDALAVALCHLQRLAASDRPYRDWKTFVALHPERVAK
jgi:crossover junction endodeoxyribonuclease RuvC